MPAPRNPLEGQPRVELVQDGFDYTEGPIWHEPSQALFFADLRRHAVFRYTPGGKLEPILDDSGDAAGLEIFNGEILLAQMKAQQLGRLDLSQPSNPRIRQVVTAENDKLNDLASWRERMVFLTAPATRKIFRYVPGRALELLWQGPQGTKPNGIAVSPDGKTLYVSDTYQNLVRAFALDEEGGLGEERVLARQLGLNLKAAELVTDGLAVDQAGNLYVATYERPNETAPGEIAVLAPTGQRWGRLIVPTGPTNCAFGDADHRTLYITARGALYRVRLEIPGF